MKQEIDTYDDIMDREHPVSQKHVPMDRLARAAQFAPFAALTGHKEAIHETSRLTEDKIILDEQRKIYLDAQIQRVALHIKEKPQINLTYFQKDARKEGGRYCTETKRIKEINEVERVLLCMDKTSIPIADIIEIEWVELEDTN